MALATYPVGYFSPTFFTPFYFPSWAGPALPGDIPTARYFSPTFFTPFYFPSWAGAALPSEIPSARFFSPSFFTPFYFPSWAGSPLPDEIPTARYFAPSFFSQFFFAPLLPLAVVPPDVPDSLYRDYDGLVAVVAALRGTDEFADVSLGASVEGWGGANVSPVAIITPEDWFESDETDPVVILRQVCFSLAISVRADAINSGYDRLDRLACVAQNSISGAGLGGFCLPSLTAVSRGRYDPSAVFPEVRIVLQGEFAYLIPSRDGRKISA